MNRAGSQLWPLIKQTVLQFVYPTFCLHCQGLVTPEAGFFCETCSSLLQLIDPIERCPACFSADYVQAARFCHSCYHHSSSFIQASAAAFEYQGPAVSLIKKLKYHYQPYLAQGAAAFLALQFDRLQWPVPDVLVPVPISLMHWLDRGYNQSALIAQHLSRFLNVPVWDILRRQSGDYSQAGLSFAQRQQLTGHQFFLKEEQPHALYDKTLLLIDDVITTGKTLERCAEVLLEGYPSRLYALALCKT